MRPFVFPLATTFAVHASPFATFDADRVGKAGGESHLITMDSAAHGFHREELNWRICRYLDKRQLHRQAAICDEPIQIR